VTHNEYRNIRSSFAQARDIDPRLVAELQGVVARLVRYSGLPPSAAPYGVWNTEAEQEVFQSWVTERLIARGQLQSLLDQAANLESFRRLAERSLRQHVLNERDRSQAQNLFSRSKELLGQDDDFHKFVEAARPQDDWWGLAAWRDDPRSPFAADDDRLLAELWALGDFTLIRYRPDARKLSPLLSTQELKRLLEGLFGRVQALLTLSLTIRAVERRFDLGDVRTESLEIPEAQAIGTEESDELVLDETALAVIAALTSRQIEVLLGKEEGETIDTMSERLECSVGTIVNEERRIAAVLDQNSEDAAQHATVLRKVLDLLYREDGKG
jgi:hypothetical protein